MATQTAIVMAHFSPCEYALPKKHFIDSVALLSKEQAELVVVQHRMPWQNAIKMPAGVNYRWYMSDSYMFYKENLWNLGATMTKAENLIFLDADVLLEPVDWLRRVESVLASRDIVQPFEFCEWIGKDSERQGVVKESAAKAISQGLQPDASKYHSGFGWAMTREAFNRLGGFFDLNVAGSGDTALALALTKGEADSGLFHWFTNNQDASPSWKRYRKNALKQNFKVGFASGVTVKHKWHGDQSNRGYCTRDKLFVRKDDGEHPASRRQDGLLVWDDPEVHNVGPIQYFSARLEDG